MAFIGGLLPSLGKEKGPNEAVSKLECTFRKQREAIATEIEAHGETMLYVIGDAFRESGPEGRNFLREATVASAKASPEAVTWLVEELAAKGLPGFPLFKDHINEHGLLGVWELVADLFSLVAPFTGVKAEDSASFYSAGDRLSRQSSFASASQAFGSGRSERDDSEGTSYEQGLGKAESRTAFDEFVQAGEAWGASPKAKRALRFGAADREPQPRLDRFYSANSTFASLSRHGSLGPRIGSQDLSGFEESVTRLSTLIGSSSSPDLERALSSSSRRGHSGPLPGGPDSLQSTPQGHSGPHRGALELLPTNPLGHLEDYTFVGKWKHEGGSPSVRSSSLGGRSSSREVMMWMGEAGMLDEEDEMIIFDETASQKEAPKESPRGAFNWWPFGSRQPQESIKQTLPATSEDPLPAFEQPFEDTSASPAFEGDPFWTQQSPNSAREPAQIWRRSSDDEEVFSEERTSSGGENVAATERLFSQTLGSEAGRGDAGSQYGSPLQEDLWLLNSRASGGGMEAVRGHGVFSPAVTPTKPSNLEAPWKLTVRKVSRSDEGMVRDHEGTYDCVPSRAGAPAPEQATAQEGAVQQILEVRGASQQEASQELETAEDGTSALTAPSPQASADVSSAEAGEDVDSGDVSSSEESPAEQLRLRSDEVSSSEEATADAATQPAAKHDAEKQASSAGQDLGPVNTVFFTSQGVQPPEQKVSRRALSVDSAHGGQPAKLVTELESLSEEELSSSGRVASLESASGEPGEKTDRAFLSGISAGANAEMDAAGTGSLWESREVSNREGTERANLSAEERPSNLPYSQDLPSTANSAVTSNTEEEGGHEIEKGTRTDLQSSLSPPGMSPAVGAAYSKLLGGAEGGLCKPLPQEEGGNEQSRLRLELDLEEETRKEVVDAEEAGLSSKVQTEAHGTQTGVLLVGVNELPGVTALASSTSREGVHNSGEPSKLGGVRASQDAALMVSSKEKGLDKGPEVAEAPAPSMPGTSDVGSSKGAEAREEDSGKPKKPKSTFWKKMFSWKVSKAEPADEGAIEEKESKETRQQSSPPSSSQPVERRSAEEEVLWLGLVKDEEEPLGWSDSNEASSRQERWLQTMKSDAENWEQGLDNSKQEEAAMALESGAEGGLEQRVDAAEVLSLPSTVAETRLEGDAALKTKLQGQKGLADRELKDSSGEKEELLKPLSAQDLREAEPGLFEVGSKDDSAPRIDSLAEAAVLSSSKGSETDLPTHLPFLGAEAKDDLVDIEEEASKGVSTRAGPDYAVRRREGHLKHLGLVEATNEELATQTERNALGTVAGHGAGLQKDEALGVFTPSEARVAKRQAWGKLEDDDEVRLEGTEPLRGNVPSQVEVRQPLKESASADLHYEGRKASGSAFEVGSFHEVPTSKEEAPQEGRRRSFEKLDSPKASKDSVATSVRPLPVLERSPSPEIPTRRNPRGDNGSPVLQRINVPGGGLVRTVSSRERVPELEEATLGHSTVSTPTPASTPTSTLAEQSGLPPGAVKAMSKGGGALTGGIAPPAVMQVGSLELPTFDAGFAKLRINLEAYQPPVGQLSDLKTPLKPLPLEPLCPPMSKTAVAEALTSHQKEAPKEPADQLGSFGSIEQLAASAETDSTSTPLGGANPDRGLTRVPLRPDTGGVPAEKLPQRKEAEASSSASDSVPPTEAANREETLLGTSNEASTSAVLEEPPAPSHSPGLQSPGASSFMPADSLAPQSQQPGTFLPEPNHSPLLDPQTPKLLDVRITEAAHNTGAADYRSLDEALEEPDSPTSAALGDLIRIAEGHLAEARKRLAAASVNGREIGLLSPGLESDGSGLIEDTGRPGPDPTTSESLGAANEDLKLQTAASNGVLPAAVDSHVGQTRESTFSGAEGTRVEAEKGGVEEKAVESISQTPVLLRGTNKTVESKTLLSKGELGLAPVAAGAERSSPEYGLAPKDSEPERESSKAEMEGKELATAWLAAHTPVLQAVSISLFKTNGLPSESPRQTEKKAPVVEKSETKDSNTITKDVCATLAEKGQKQETGSVIGEQAAESGERSDFKLSDKILRAKQEVEKIRAALVVAGKGRAIKKGGQMDTLKETSSGSRAELESVRAKQDDGGGKRGTKGVERKIIAEEVGRTAAGVVASLEGAKDVASVAKTKVSFKEVGAMFPAERKQYSLSEGCGQVSLRRHGVYLQNEKPPPLLTISWDQGLKSAGAGKREMAVRKSWPASAEAADRIEMSSKLQTASKDTGKKPPLPESDWAVGRQRTETAAVSPVVIPILSALVRTKQNSGLSEEAKVKESEVLSVVQRKEEGQVEVNNRVDLEGREAGILPSPEEPTEEKKERLREERHEALQGEMERGETLQGELERGKSLQREVGQGPEALQGELERGGTLQGERGRGSTLQGELEWRRTLQGELGQAANVHKEEAGAANSEETEGEKALGQNKTVGGLAEKDERSELEGLNEPEAKPVAREVLGNNYGAKVARSGGSRRSKQGGKKPRDNGAALKQAIFGVLLKEEPQGEQPKRSEESEGSKENHSSRFVTQIASRVYLRLAEEKDVVAKKRRTAAKEQVGADFGAASKAAGLQVENLKETALPVAVARAPRQPSETLVDFARALPDNPLTPSVSPVNSIFNHGAESQVNETPKSRHKKKKPKTPLLQESSSSLFQESDFSANKPSDVLPPSNQRSTVTRRKGEFEASLTKQVSSAKPNESLPAPPNILVGPSSTFPATNPQNLPPDTTFSVKRRGARSKASRAIKESSAKGEWNSPKEKSAAGKDVRVSADRTYSRERSKRGPGSSSPSRSLTRTPRLKIASPIRTRKAVLDELPRTPTLTGRRTRVTSVTHPSPKPRPAQIAPMDLTGAKDEGALRDIFSFWDEEERNCAVSQLQDARDVLKQRTKLDSSADQTASRGPPSNHQGPRGSLSAESLQTVGVLDGHVTDNEGTLLEQSPIMHAKDGESNKSGGLSSPTKPSAGEFPWKKEVEAGSFLGLGNNRATAALHSKEASLAPLDGAAKPTAQGTKIRMSETVSASPVGGPSGNSWENSRESPEAGAVVQTAAAASFPAPSAAAPKKRRFLGDLFRRKKKEDPVPPVVRPTSAPPFPLVNTATPSVRPILPALEPEETQRQSQTVTRTTRRAEPQQPVKQSQKDKQTPRFLTAPRKISVADVTQSLNKRVDSRVPGVSSWERSTSEVATNGSAAAFRKRLQESMTLLLGEPPSSSKPAADVIVPASSATRSSSVSPRPINARKPPLSPASRLNARSPFRQQRAPSRLSPSKSPDNMTSAKRESLERLSSAAAGWPKAAEEGVAQAEVSRASGHAAAEQAVLATTFPESNSPPESANQRSPPIFPLSLPESGFASSEDASNFSRQILESTAVKEAATEGSQAQTDSEPGQQRAAKVGTFEEQGELEALGGAESPAEVTPQSVQLVESVPAGEQKSGNMSDAADFSDGAPRESVPADGREAAEYDLQQGSARSTWKGSSREMKEDRPQLSKERGNSPLKRSGVSGNAAGGTTEQEEGTPIRERLERLYGKSADGASDGKGAAAASVGEGLLHLTGGSGGAESALDGGALVAAKAPPKKRSSWLRGVFSGKSKAKLASAAETTATQRSGTCAEPAKSPLSTKGGVAPSTGVAMTPASETSPAAKLQSDDQGLMEEAAVLPFGDEAARKLDMLATRSCEGPNLLSQSLPEDTFVAKTPHEESEAQSFETQKGSSSLSVVDAREESGAAEASPTDTNSRDYSNMTDPIEVSIDSGKEGSFESVPAFSNPNSPTASASQAVETAAEEVQAEKRTASLQKGAPLLSVLEADDCVQFPRSPNSRRTIKAAQMERGFEEPLDLELVMSPNRRGSRADFPFKYSPSNKVRSPRSSPRGAAFGAAFTPLLSPFSPARSGVSTEDFERLRKEASELSRRQRDGVVRSRSRDRKEGGDVIFAAPENQAGHCQESREQHGARDKREALGDQRSRGGGRGVAEVVGQWELSDALARKVAPSDLPALGSSPSTLDQREKNVKLSLFTAVYESGGELDEKGGRRSKAIPFLYEQTSS